jgi:hypothetical protein
MYLFKTGLLLALLASAAMASILPYNPAYKQLNEHPQGRNARLAEADAAEHGANANRGLPSFSARILQETSSFHPGGQVRIALETHSQSSHRMKTVTARVRDGATGAVVAEGLAAAAGQMVFEPREVGTFVIECVADFHASDATDTMNIVVRVVEPSVVGVKGLRMQAHPDALKGEMLVALRPMRTKASSGPFLVTVELARGAQEVVVHGLADVDANGELVLGMRAEWLAEAKGEVMARSVSVRCGKTGAHLTTSRNLHVALDGEIPAAPPSLPEVARMGSPPPFDPMMEAGGSRRLLSASHRIFLLHGYCSSNQWDLADFGGAGIAINTVNNLNMPTLTYAYEAVVFAASQGYAYSSGKSCSFAGHSHGGVAAATIYTYWWTCLDNNAGSSYLTASLGSPIYGTALAGNLAAIGEIFGIGCGANYDLTHQGAAEWAAGIPSWARSRHYSVSTTFNDRWWAWDYCHLASDVVLNDPEDGMVERSRAYFGGYAHKHYEGYCHTDAMRDPYQVTEGPIAAFINDRLRV